MIFYSFINFNSKRNMLQLNCFNKVKPLLFFIIFLITVSCRQSNENTQEVKTKKTIAMNVIVSQVPFWTDSKQKMISLQNDLNIKTIFGGPTDDNAQTQINEIQNLITQKVDGLIIYPTNSKTLLPIINKAVDSGIPVITMLADVPGSKRLMYITSELEEASKSVADYVFKTNKKEGKVIILMGSAGSEEQERRANGFKQAIASFSKMKVVDVIEDKFDASTGAKNLKASIIREGKIDYIFGCDSRSASAAKLALDELKYNKNKVVITGWDSDADMIQYIQKGDVYVSAVQQTSFITHIAVNTLLPYINGTIYPQNLDLKAHNVSPVPDKLVVPINLITQKTAPAYLKKK